MQIGIDLTPLIYTLTGIGVYVQQMVSAVSHEEPTLRWTYPNCQAFPMSNVYRLLMRNKIDRSILDRVDFDFRWSLGLNSQKVSSSARLSPGKMDLYHVTNSLSKYHEFDLPMVMTVHDLAWLKVSRAELPAPNYRGIDRIQSLIQKAAHVICDSECTRQDVIELVGRKPDDVSTVHLAHRDWCFPVDSPEQEKSARKFASGGNPYFLAISTIEPRKNYERLIHAFAAVKTKLPDHRLLIAGAKRSAWPNVRQAIRDHRLETSVQVLGYTKDSVLRNLLWGANALVCPSLYEGFGLPVLEAMACGVPVVCSPAGSLQEVVSDAAILVDPLDVDSIADGLLQVATDPSLCESLRRKSLRNAERFSWTKTAKETLRVYRRVMRS